MQLRVLFCYQEEEGHPLHPHTFQHSHLRGPPQSGWEVGGRRQWNDAGARDKPAPVRVRQAPEARRPYWIGILFSHLQILCGSSVISSYPFECLFIGYDEGCLLGSCVMFVAFQPSTLALHNNCVQWWNVVLSRLNLYGKELCPYMYFNSTYLMGTHASTVKCYNQYFLQGVPRTLFAKSNMHFKPHSAQSEDTCLRNPICLSSYINPKQALCCHHDMTVHWCLCFRC